MHFENIIIIMHVAHLQVAFYEQTETP